MASTITDIDVGASQDFGAGSLTLVDAGGIEVGVVRWESDVYAIRNVCPHQLGPVCKGRLLPTVHSDEAGVVATDRSRPVIICAWHGWEFDVRTGRCSADPTYHVRTYPVKERDGRIFIEMPARHQRALAESSAEQ